MIEPSNSYHVSYLITYFKPKWDIGMTEKQLMLILGQKTCGELRNWFYKYGTHKWLKEHKELKLAR